MNKVGDMYRDGLGVNKSDKEAAKWYRKAQEQKEAEASEAAKPAGQ
jgi:TPR repeat protein